MDLKHKNTKRISGRESTLPGYFTQILRHSA